MTLYIDVIFAENIIMNYIILLTTKLIIQNNSSHLRIFLSSILGAIYIVISYITQLKIYSNQIIKFILSVAMVYVALNPTNIKKLCKAMIIFYLTSFCFGGAAYYLLYNISPEQIKNINGVLTGIYPLKIALLGSILGFFILRIAFKVIKSKIDKNSMFFDIEIVYKQNKKIVPVLLDTGNLLVEPITSFPVTIIEARELHEILDENSLNILRNSSINKLDELDEDLKVRCRVIPFSSVGKNNGMLIGFKPDYIKIYNEDEQTMIKDAIIGVCDNKISKNKKYSGLIGLELLNSENGKIGDFNEYHSNAKI